MNPEELRDYFLSETDSEKQYKTLNKNIYFDTLESTIIHGIEAKILPASFQNKFVNESNSLYLKKNSRFCVTPYHVHDWIEINYLYSGSCTEYINDKEYKLKPGQVVLIDKDTPHKIGYTSKNDILVSIILRPSYLNANFFSRLSKENLMFAFFINAIQAEKEHNNFVFFKSEKNRKVALYMQELACEMIDPSAYNTDIIDSLLTLVLCELMKVYDENNETLQDFAKDTSMAELLRYIETNYATCTLESTAAHFGLNSSYLSSLIKKRLGTNYRDLVLKQRMKIAVSYLRNTDLSITQIANHVGYENMNFFYKKFKEVFHCSPKEYRNYLQKSLLDH